MVFRPKTLRFICDRCKDGEHCGHAGRRMFVDGFRVMPSQLTDDELREWFPDLYYAQEKKEVQCPLCTETVELYDKRSIVTHVRKKHILEWGKLGDEIQALKYPIEVARLVYNYKRSTQKEKEEASV